MEVLPRTITDILLLRELYNSPTSPHKKVPILDSNLVIINYQQFIHSTNSVRHSTKCWIHKSEQKRFLLSYNLQCGEDKTVIKHITEQVLTKSERVIEKQI